MILKLTAPEPPRLRLTNNSGNDSSATNGIVCTYDSHVISDYLLACEAGTAPSLDTLCEQHPDFADGIRDYFRETDQLAANLQMPTVDAVQIDGYEVVKEIGRGGMGVVFEARQLSLGRSVAIKVLRDAALSSSSIRARFDKEAQLIAQLKHDNIVDVIEFGRVDDRPFLVMPLLEGQPLSRSISKEPLSEKAAAKIMLTVTDAVQFAHSQGVIHRDIKPGNIMGDDERCQVMDFGLAFVEDSDQRLTGTGDVIGTLGFLAPEIIRGQSRGDVATDVYALGATLYSLLVGQSPHRAATAAAESMMLAMQGEPVEPGRGVECLSGSLFLGQLAGVLTNLMSSSRRGWTYCGRLTSFVVRPKRSSLAG